MRRIRNDRLIRRNSLLARVLLFGGLGILAVGFLVSLASPGQVLPFLVVAIVGMLSSQLGTTLMTRWARGPRVDEVIDSGLKGLDDRYAIVHYSLGAGHALLSPSGIYALVPVVEEGVLQESAGKWTRRLPRRGRLRPAKTESMGDLAARGQGQTTALRKGLRRAGWEAPETTVRPLLLFLSAKAEVESSADADPPAVHLKKLKDWLRHQPRAEGLAPDRLSALIDRLAEGPKKK